MILCKQINVKELVKLIISDGFRIRVLKTFQGVKSDKPHDPKKQ